MKTGAAAKPYYIDWAITCACNLRCAHCRGTFARELHTPRALALLDEMAALEPGWLIIEGGEPLLRPDLFAILGRARSLGLRVFLISNGMLVSEETIASLSRLGVSVMLSIDSPDAATFEGLRKGAEFGQVVRAAARCAEAGVLDAINFTLSRRNIRQIPALFALAARLGAQRLNILGLKPCEHYPEMLLAPEEYRGAIESCCRASSETGVRFFFDEPFFAAGVREWGCVLPPAGEKSSITIESEPGCIIGRYLFLTPEGKVWPCSFAPAVMGDAARESLKEIWEKMEGDDLLKRLADPATRKGACGACRFLEQCRGCRARAFGLTGDWFEADPACPLK